MLAETGEFSTLQRLGSTLIRLGQQRRSSLLTGTGLHALGSASFAANHFEEGFSFIQQALPYLEQSGELGEQIEVCNTHGIFLYMTRRLPEAQATFHRALELSGDSQDDRVIRARANTCNHLSLAKQIAGWPVESRGYAQRALSDSIARKTSPPR